MRFKLGVMVPYPCKGPFKRMNKETITKDITLDFLRCNRCGKCRAVCPVVPVFKEEWASARGKVELAEVYFRDGKLDEKKLYAVFDYCLQCMTCEENCPSGVRANELVMAVRADLARKGRVPWIKRMALRMLRGMDNLAFKLMRGFHISREWVAGAFYGVRGRRNLQYHNATQSVGQQGRVSGAQSERSLQHFSQPKGTEQQVRVSEVQREEPLKYSPQNQYAGKRDRAGGAQRERTRKEALHGIGGKSFLSALFPLLGWPRARVVPLPVSKPFLKVAREFYPADGLDIRLPSGVRIDDVPFPEGSEGGRSLLSLLNGALSNDAEPGSTELRRALDFIRGELKVLQDDMPGALDLDKASRLVLRIAVARKANMARGLRSYYFVGHAVNHFFPEEAEALVFLLNVLGVDVLVPKDQLCCGAPVYYAGDLEGAVEYAERALERLSKKEYSFIVTSCATGGHMLKREYPRLLGLVKDTHFRVRWDKKTEAFVRDDAGSGSSGVVAGEDPKLQIAQSIFTEKVQGRIFDINEVVARMLGFEKREESLQDLISGSGQENSGKITGSEYGSAQGDKEEYKSKQLTERPLVTYHHPCHLNRGQDVNWQPEEILRSLPGFRYEQMEDADRCCGGGGAFTFAHAKASDRIADRKVEAIAKLKPDILATSCPICRVQLTDIIERHLVLERERDGKEPLSVAVTSTTELIVEDILKVLMVEGTEK